MQKCRRNSLQPVCAWHSKNSGPSSCACPRDAILGRGKHSGEAGHCPNCRHLWQSRCTSSSRERDGLALARRGTRISPVRAAFVLCVTSPMVFGCATGTRPGDALAWLSIHMVLPQCRDRIPGRSQSHVPFEVLFCLLHGTKPACWLHEPLTHL